MNRYVIYNEYCRIAYAFLAHTSRREFYRHALIDFSAIPLCRTSCRRDPAPFPECAPLLLPEKKTEKLRGEGEIYIATLKARQPRGRRRVYRPAHEQDALPIVASGLRRTPFHPPANDRALCPPDVACITNVTREP